MQTVTEYLRKHLLETLGVHDKRDCLPGLDELRQTEWSTEFEEKMRHRLLMGAFRYGLFSSPDKWKYDRVAGAKKKLALYESTGNTEHLVDVANYALLEFVRPSHAEAHFRAEDDYHHCPIQGG